MPRQLSYAYLAFMVALILAMYSIACTNQDQVDLVDLKVIAFGFDEHGTVISQIDLNSGRRQDVTDQLTIFPTSYSYHAASRSLVFAAFVEDGQELILMRPDTIRGESLTWGNNHYWAPAWSPDGHLIAMEDHSELMSSIRIIDVETKEIQSLINNPSTSLRRPVWSPNQKYISAVSIVRDGQTEEKAYDLVVIDVRSGEIIRVIKSALRDEFEVISWSPDSRRLAFPKKVGNETEIAILDLASESIQLFTSPDYHVKLIRWFDHGASVAVLQSRNGNNRVSIIGVADLGTGLILPTSENYSWITSLVVVTDGLLLFSTYDESSDETGFFLLSMATGEAREFSTLKGRFENPTIMNPSP